MLPSVCWACNMGTQNTALFPRDECGDHYLLTKQDMYALSRNCECLYTTLNVFPSNSYSRKNTLSVQKNTSLRQVPPNHTGVCVAREMYTEEEVNRNNGGCIEYLAPSTIGSRLWVGGKCLPLPTSGSLVCIHIHVHVYMHNVYPIMHDV